MTYLTIDLLCANCGHRLITTLPKEEATYEGRWDCVECSSESSLRRVPSAPMVLKASWPDGRTNGTMRDIREATRLRLEAADAPPERKAEIEKEAAKLTKLGKDN